MEEVDSTVQDGAKGDEARMLITDVCFVCMLYYKQEATLGALSGSNDFPHFLLSDKWE